MLSNIIWIKNFIRIVIVFAIVFALYSSPNLVAQEIKATVTVSFNQEMPQNERENLTGLQADVAAYLNSQSFTGKEFKSEADKIKWKDEQVEMNLSITILSGNQATSRYNAWVIVTAQRPLFGGQKKSVTFQMFDKNWSFLYSRGAVPSFQPLRFDEFASFLDMYALIAIGMDLDSYSELGGTAVFQRAQQIIQMGAGYTDPTDGSGATASAYRINIDNPGAVSRAGLVQELLDVRMDALRRIMAAYYLNGMDYLGDKPDDAKASIDALLVKIADFKDRLTSRSILLQVLFDAKYRELTDLFKDTKLPKVWDKLKYIDPSHTIQYEQAQRGK